MHNAITTTVEVPAPKYFVFSNEKLLSKIKGIERRWERGKKSIKI